ncbi:MULTISPECIES: Ada metal-binding domain-containing protein [unclassified Acinetobacter]|uniref:Ada metal-binding domain-containing protein n=1 Tax=unclassified Acinetobacter TaxID=196816 RepID=UPI0015D29CD9|nr:MULTISPECIES: Ada metal-binding domain-containing protein [unclassified Acinetobacter]
MIRHEMITDQELYGLLRQEKILFGGNLNLKIYGSLRCRSGKRMKRKNRVFFKDEVEALAQGYRPCGHCMKQAYMDWKNGYV